MHCATIKVIDLQTEFVKANQMNKQVMHSS